MKDQPLVSVVIVTWNNEKDIRECLESILAQDYENFKVVVVDNNSSDGTCQIVDEYKDVVLLRIAKNLFLTGGNNFGIKYSFQKFDPKYVMVLNPDTKVENNLISELVKAVEMKPEYGAAGPKVKFFKNANEGLINSAGLIYDGFDQAYDRGFKDEDRGQFDQVKEVFGVSGTCILYKSEMLKQIGLYWDQIKMYLDEVELFIRAKKKGWKAVYTPKTTIWHSYMQSTDKNKIFNHKKQKARAWLFIALRHYSFKSKLAMLGKYIDFRVGKVVQDPPVVENS